MRNYGVNERYITGEATNREKFTAYCKTLSTAFGNPLYHWSQAELKAFFCCEKEINEENAEAIWEECNAYIRENNLTPQKLIESSNVKYLFTTNEVFDDLCYVVIELKTGDFKPEYVGQLNFYLSAVDGELKKNTDNPTIGLLLCKSKNNLVAEYSLKDMSKPMGISEYKFGSVLPEELSRQLPSIEDIQKRIK